MNQGGQGPKGAPFSLVSSCCPSDLCQLTSRSSSSAAAAERNETVIPRGASEPPRKKIHYGPPTSHLRGCPSTAPPPGRHDLSPTAGSVAVRSVRAFWREHKVRRRTRSGSYALADGGGSSNSSCRRNQNENGACGQPSGASSSSDCAPYGVSEIMLHTLPMLWTISPCWRK